MKRAAPAQNQLRNGDLGSIISSEMGIWGQSRAPLAVLGQERGIWGSARPGAPPVLTPLAHLFLPLILGGNFYFLSLFLVCFFLEQIVPFWGESRRFWHCHCGEGRETTGNPSIPQTCSSIPFALGQNLGKMVQKLLPLPKHHAKALTKHFFGWKKPCFLF